MASLRERKEWQFFSVVPRADRRLAAAWWIVHVVRGVLPALFAIAMGVVVGAVQRGDELGKPLVLVGLACLLLQILAPIHLSSSANLGDRAAAWLEDRL